MFSTKKKKESEKCKNDLYIEIDLMIVRSETEDGEGTQGLEKEGKKMCGGEREGGGSRAKINLKEKLMGPSLKLSIFYISYLIANQLVDNKSFKRKFYHHQARRLTGKKLS